MEKRAGKRKSILESSDHLSSDVSASDAESALAFVQTFSTSFNGYTDEEISTLSSHLSVMTFDEGQTVVEKGEPGTYAALEPARPRGAPLLELQPLTTSMGCVSFLRLICIH